MNETVNAPGVDNLEELERAAQQSTQRLSQANGRNAIWDKALKALKPGLADLQKIREEAGTAAEEAKRFLSELETSYDSDASDSVRETRTAVDKEIDDLNTAMGEAIKSLNTAKDKVVVARSALEKSTADWELAQKNLLAVPKEIQDGQKLILGLQGEARDAHAKHLLVETVVKLEDLRRGLGSLDTKMAEEHTTELWQAWNNATRELITRTDAHLQAQADVPPLETAVKEAKTKYEEASKNRLNDIKKRVADEERSSKTGHYQTAAAI
jgi:chromosome segregation ATPase